MTRLTLVLLAAAFLTAQSAPEVEITAEPHHHPVLTNHQVRVFQVELPPHGETLLHRHRHDYIYVTLGDSEVSNAVKGKDPVTVKLQDGQTGFLSRNYAHVARNLRDQPFRIVNIELLQDDKLRTSSAKWDEDRGLDILHGGTKEILFVKDTVRVSEIELQPNAALPGGSNARPVLLIALTDLDFLTSDPRTHDTHTPAPTPVHSKTGDVIWLPLGFRRPIVNAGPHNAKFIALEFH